jgi:hypothetical protein
MSNPNVKHKVYLTLSPRENLVEQLKTWGMVTEISRETVRPALKQTHSDLGKSSVTVSQRGTWPVS